jgi:hypothetical protein
MFGEAHDVCCEPLGDVFSGLVLERDEHPKTGGAFHKRGDLAAAGTTDDEVTFPVARDSAIVDFGGPFGDHYLVRDARGLRGASLGSALRASGAQTGSEILAESSFGLHVEGLIDRFVRHPPLWLTRMISAQLPSDLLR